MEKIDLMLEITEKTGLYDEGFFKTGVMAKKLNVSQQTISNSLKDIEKAGLIKREPSHTGIKISITEEGIKFLENYKNKINSFFEGPKELKATLFTGIGEGSFYIMQKGYKDQFKEKLGLNPFNGTLNLRADQVTIRSFLSGKKIVIVNEFKSNNRTFGGLKAYPVKINGLKGAVIIPDRTHYAHDTIEIISDYFLRGKLKLKDGDKVKLTEA